MRCFSIFGLLMFTACPLAAPNSDAGTDTDADAHGNVITKDIDVGVDGVEWRRSYTYLDGKLATASSVYLPQ